MFFSDTRNKRRTWQNKVKQLTDAYPTICDKGEATKLIPGCLEDSTINQKMNTKYDSFIERMKAKRYGRQEEIYKNRLANYKTLLEQVNLSLEKPISEDIQSSLLKKKGIIEGLIKKCESDDEGEDWTVDEVINPDINLLINSFNDFKKKFEQNIIDLKTKIDEKKSGINLETLEELDIINRLNVILQGFVTASDWEQICNKNKELCIEKIRYPLIKMYDQLLLFFDGLVDSIIKLKNNTKTRDLGKLKAFRNFKLKLLENLRTNINNVNNKAEVFKSNGMIDNDLTGYTTLYNKLNNSIGSNSLDVSISIQTERLLKTVQDSGHRLFSELEDNGVYLKDHFKSIRHLVPTDLECTVDIFDIYYTYELNGSSFIKDVADGYLTATTYAVATGAQIVNNTLNILPGVNRLLGGIHIHDPMNDVNAIQDDIVKRGKKSVLW